MCTCGRFATPSSRLTRATPVCGRRSRNSFSVPTVQLHASLLSWLLFVLHTARHWEDLTFNIILITFLGFDLISRTTFNQCYYSCPPVEEVMSPFKTALPKVARVIQALMRKHYLEPYRQVISVSCAIWDWGLIPYARRSHDILGRRQQPLCGGHATARVS